jgi:hypothetical protein
MKTNIPMSPKIPCFPLGEQLCQECRHVYEAAIGFKTKQGILYLCQYCWQIRVLKEQIETLEYQRENET